MKIELINNYNINKTNSLNFKGTVSQEFVKYVDTLRGDCIHTVPKESSTFINNVCDKIINKAQRIMNNCFSETSVLSVDTKKAVLNDTITYTNSILQKHLPGYIYPAYFISKTGDETPVHRLLKLHEAIISGNCFAGSNKKEYTALFYPIDLIENSGRLFPDNLFNKDEFLKDAKYLLEFWLNKIDSLNAEINHKKWCSLVTKDEYSELLKKVNDLI